MQDALSFSIKGLKFVREGFFVKRKKFMGTLKALSVTNDSNGSRTASRATWALLLWPTWLAAAVRESTLLFVTEKDLKV